MIDLDQLNSAERAVLSILVSNPTRIYELKDLKPYMLSSEPAKALLKVMQDLSERSLVPDINLIASELESKNQLNTVGGTAFLYNLKSFDFPQENLLEYVSILVDGFRKIKILELSNKLPAMLEGSTSGEVLDQIRKDVDNLVKETGGEDTESISSIISRIAKDIFHKINSDNKVFGYQTGFEVLDKYYGGVYPGEVWIIAGRPGMGKCLGKGTKILMYDGTLKVVENIKVGDKLLGPDSKPRNILSISTGTEMMYWIRQKHGIDYRVNESHILSLKRSKNEKKQKKGKVLNISVKDTLKSNYIISRYKGYKTSIDFEHKDTILDPYFLGLWLGDGHSSDARIYNTDSEIIDYLNIYAKDLGMMTIIGSKNRSCKSYNITHGMRGNHKLISIKSILRKLNLINNKHIPDDFIINSEDIRLKLLAGLIDSDGYYNGYSYEITSKIKSLAEQIKFLCDTLGYRTSIKYRKARCQTGAETDVWRIRFSGDTNKIPIKVNRKKSKTWTSNIDWKVTGITIEKDKIDEYYGFTIDRDGLFLLEDMTVTHNTALMCNSMLATARAGNPVLSFSVEMTKGSLLERLVAIDQKLEVSNLRLGLLNKDQAEQVKYSLHNIENLPIYIDTNYMINSSYIQSTVRKLHQLHGIRLVYIDYIQLVAERNAEAVHEIGRISRMCKLLAKDLDIGFIIFSQLNRLVELREEKRPILSDLRQSGNLEEDGDVIAFLYRDELYNKESKGKGIMEFIFGKVRFGACGAAPLYFDAPTNIITSS